MSRAADQNPFAVLAGFAPDARYPLTPPANIEAEQALLGVLLMDSAAMSRVDGLVRGRDFAEPFHGRLFDLMHSMGAQGHAYDPILLARRFDSDPGFEELGGLRYLGDLVDRAPPFISARDYAAAIYEVAARRDVLLLCAQQATAAMMGEVDAGAMLEEFDRALMSMRTGNRQLHLEGIDEVIERIDEHVAEPKPRGPMPGIKVLDEKMGELQAGSFIVLAGRSSMGKSALAGNLEVNIARQRDPDGRPYGVISFNGEMTAEQMVQRHIANHGFTLDPDNAPSYRSIDSGKMTDVERMVYHRAARELRTLPIRMLRRTGITVGQIRSIARRQKAIWAAKGIALGAVVIDHMGLVRPDVQSNNFFQDQNLVAMAGKELADELETCIVGLVQVSRNTESRDDKRPTLADLKNSGGYEENADAVIAAYREAYYASKEAEPDMGKSMLKWNDWDARRRSKIVELIFLKFRGGATGPVKAWGDMARNAIRTEEPRAELSDAWAFE